MTRNILNFDAGWRFSRDFETDSSLNGSGGGIAWTEDERNLLGFEPEPGQWDGVTWSKAGKCYGPAGEAYDDGGWRAVNLPHDWCVEQTPRQDAPVRNGFLPTGVGWYRKTFATDPAWIGRRVSLQFDGVFRDCTVFVNGHLVARNLGGYIGFEAGIDTVLNHDRPNVLAVRVDARNKEGWFYEGCGIYRPVRLIVTDPLHIEHDGVHVTPELINGDRPAVAAVKLRTEIFNDADVHQAFALIQTISSPSGSRAAQLRRDVTLGPGERGSFEQNVELAEPAVWGIDNPRLYTVQTMLERDDQAIDTVTDSFGVRSCRFDAAKGFFLNGEPVKLKGVCCHQDHAGVGMAIPVSLQVWRLEQLQAMGVNAYRCAHNPPAREVLEACDRLGIVVIDEARVFGISEEHISQAVRMVRRDRNHPCVILWSLGNEEMGVQCTAAGARMFTQVRRRLREHDTSRLFTAAINVGWDTAEGFIEHEDVHGINYLNQGDLATLRRLRPELPVIVSEAASAVSTRGVYESDAALGQVSCYDDHEEPRGEGVKMWPYWGRAAEASWKVVAERPDLAGTFVWTGFDYRGEQSPFVRWPAVGSHFGIMDLCGFPKDVYWYYKAWWSQEPVLHVFPHWNWPNREGESIDVWVYSNASTVQLSLNGERLGEFEVPTNGHVQCPVEYQPGELRAVGIWEDGSTSETVIATTGPAVAIKLDVQEPGLRLGEPDAVMVAISVVDAEGQTVPTAMAPLRFETEGGIGLMGLGNGDPNSHEIDRPASSRVAQRSAFHGLSQAILQPAGPDDSGRLTVTSPGLRPATLELSPKPRSAANIG